MGDVVEADANGAVGERKRVGGFGVVWSGVDDIGNAVDACRRQLYRDDHVGDQTRQGSQAGEIRGKSYERA